MRLHTFAFAAALGLGVAWGANAAPIYSGNLTYPTGLAATFQWANTATRFSWDIEAAGSNWKYTYRLQVPEKGISHFIIEVSDDFTQDDIVSYSGTDAPILDYYDANSQGNANFGMPGAFTKGLKFQQSGWGIDQTVTLITPRAPKWADLYAIDGKKPGEEVYLYNTGFNTADPGDPPSHGSIQFHILAPDTAKIPPQGGPDPIPEPGTLALLGAGLAGILRRRRR